MSEDINYFLMNMDNLEYGYYYKKMNCTDISSAFPLYKTIFWQKKHLFTQNLLEKNEMIHILYHYK